jgi:hypothetical protein
LNDRRRPGRIPINHEQQLIIEKMAKDIKEVEAMNSEF